MLNKCSLFGNSPIFKQLYISLRARAEGRLTRKRKNAHRQQGTVGKSSTVRVQIAALRFTGYVIVGKLLNLSVSISSAAQWE